MRISQIARGLLLLALLSVSSCSGARPDINTASDSLQEQAITLAGSGWQEINGGGLPEDSLLPWESLNGEGFVDPATARMSSAINENSEFWRGVDAFGTEGATSNFGQALRLESGSAGAGGRSIATYRIPLGGENPATLSTDINLRLRSDGSTSEFYIGIANYATGRWDWFGAFSDGRIRLPLSEAATGDYLSGLGNAFVAVTAYNGSNFDIVGISLNQFDPGDLNAPPAPSGLSLTPVAGGLELQWNSVLAGDLAGYRVYWSRKSFANPNAVGVKQLAYLEGGTRHVLSGLGGTTFVAVSAVDLSGNASAISGLESAAPLGGSGPVVELEADTASGIVNDNIALSASGADSYDWDLDGDGVFEITAELTGNQLADTGQAGIIRPAVRASSGGTAVALGAVSLIVASDLPPVAILSVADSDGLIRDGEVEPFSTLLDGSASYDDGAPLEFAWSQTGDGNFTSFGSQDSLQADYGNAGLYSATLRVRDSAGQEARASLLIRVRQIGPFGSTNISDNGLSGKLGSLMIIEGRPAIAYLEESAAINGVVYKRALDSRGTAWGPPVLISNPESATYATLAIIKGHPAVAYFAPVGSLIRYVRADTTTGDSQDDWTMTPVTVGVATALFLSINLADVAGNPALAWTDQATLRYTRATGADGDGSDPADWANAPFILDNSGQVDWQPQLEVVAGKPAICYINYVNKQARYIRAITDTGATPAEWPAVSIIVSGAHSCTNRVDLAIVNGRPAISFYDTPLSGLLYVRASTAEGLLVADWPVPLEVSLGEKQGFNYHSLAIIDGFPALAYRDDEFGSRTSYRRALDADGDAWGPELHVAPQGSSTEEASDFIKMVDIDGLPGIYVRSSTLERPLFCMQQLLD